MKHLKLNKKRKIAINTLIAMIIYILNPLRVNADSGLDSNYQSSGSTVGSVINAVMSLLSFIGELITAEPGSEDYSASHNITAIMCILIFYAVTAVYVFKLDTKESKKTSIKLLISLIPTAIFSLICFFTEWQLILYIFLLIIYIIPFIIISNVIVKKKIQKNILEVKEIDKKFNEEEFGKEAFNIYKEIQESWCNFEVEKIKNLISEEIFNKYTEKLEELKGKNQKNIMDQIEFKANKIINMKIENNIETIKCEMNVICYDYIIDDKEKVVKGSKDKKYNYIYELVFNKDMNTNKYVLIKKKIKKIKQ